MGVVDGHIAPRELGAPRGRHGACAARGGAGAGRGVARAGTGEGSAYARLTERITPESRSATQKTHRSCPSPGQSWVRPFLQRPRVGTGAGCRRPGTRSSAERCRRRSIGSFSHLGAGANIGRLQLRPTAATQGALVFRVCTARSPAVLGRAPRRGCLTARWSSQLCGKCGAAQHTRQLPFSRCARARALTVAIAARHLRLQPAPAWTPGRGKAGGRAESGCTARARPCVRARTRPCGAGPAPAPGPVS